MNLNLTKILYRSGGYIKKNSSTILTCLGGVGLIATAVATGFGSIKASKMVIDAREEKGEELTKLETVCAAAPAYIPPIVLGVSTLVCIFGANALNKRQQAALISAYAVLQNGYSEYRKKVNELYGENADETVKEALIEEKFKSVDFKPNSENISVFYESYYGDFFEASDADIFYAIYHFNRNFQLRGYASVAELHEFLGLPVQEADKAIGWNAEGFWEDGLVPWIDFEFYTKALDDGMEYTVMSPTWSAYSEFMTNYI